MKITKKNLMNMIKAQLEEVLSDDDRFRDLPGYEEYTDGEKLKRRRKKKPADDIPDERWREDDPIFRSHLEEELTSEGWIDSVKSAMGFGSPKKGKSLEELMQETIEAAEPLEPVGRERMDPAGYPGFNAIASAFGRGAYAGAGHDAVLELDTKILTIAGMVEGVYAAAAGAQKEAVAAGASEEDAQRAYQEAWANISNDVRAKFMHVELSVKTYEMVYRNQYIIPYIKKNSPDGIKKAAKEREKARRTFEINAAWISNLELGKSLRLGAAARGQKLEENIMKISKNKLKNMIKEELEEAMAQPSLRDVAASLQDAAAILVTGKVLEALQSSGNMEEYLEADMIFRKLLDLKDAVRNKE